MKLKGFTLAEVLVALTLIGIITALTLPALITNFEKNQAGPTLMRAIATLDNANALMVQEQDMYSFESGCGDDYKTNCFEPFIKETIGAAEDNGSIEYNYGYLSGGNQTQTLSNGYLMKNGFLYYITPTHSSPIKHALILIDINGHKRPNVLGKDLFATLVIFSDNGKIYAFGSKADPMNPSLWETTCNDTEITNAQMCAGAIVDNGGRVTYKWK